MFGLRFVKAIVGVMCVSNLFVKIDISKKTTLHSSISSTSYLKEELDDKTSMTGSVSDGGMFFESQQNRDYYQETMFDMETYFRNLSTYLPNNNIGSCSFVALCGLMSYYDTFYNDDIVPEQYERHLSNSQNEELAKRVSPGVLRNVYNENFVQTYYDFCRENQTTDLQSKLTMIKNKVDGNIDENDNLLTGHEFKFSAGSNNYQDILNEFYCLSSNVEVNLSYASQQSDYIQMIKDSIDEGNPVIVSIRSNTASDLGNHAVIAYDYIGDQIFANYGWGSYCTHIDLFDSRYGYNEIWRITTLDFSSMGHTHSNNYVINNKGICGCNLSDEVFLTESIEYRNVPPTLYWMKNRYDASESFVMSVSYNILPGMTSNLTYTCNQITFSPFLWMMLQTNNTVFNFSFRRVSSDETYNPVRYTFHLSTLTLRHVDIRSSDYGLTSSYQNSTSVNIVKDDVSANIRSSNVIVNSDELIMSGSNTSGSSHLYFSFNKPVHMISIPLAKYSDEEYYSENNTRFMLNYYEGNNQIHTLSNLLYDFNLTTDFKECILTFPYGITIFSLTINSDNIVASRNRIRVGDIQVFIEE